MVLHIHLYLRDIIGKPKGAVFHHMLKVLNRKTKSVVRCCSTLRTFTPVCQCRIVAKTSKVCAKGSGYDSLSCKNSWVSCQAKSVHSGSSDYTDDTDEEEEKDPEKAADKLLEDVNRDVQVQQFYGMPGSGHLLYVVQPVPKRSPLEERDVLTTPELQLEEAVALVHSIPKWRVANTEILRVRRIKSKHIFGPGQLDILTSNIRQTPGVSAVFVAVDHLTRLQLDSLQRCWHLPIFDRTTMVLQIFREHARTKEAKLQVALAELPYIRLRMEEADFGETETSSARFAQKTGELFLNARFMLLRKREAKLKKALEALKSQRSLIRERRTKKNIPTVAVIGYTNSGKTTLIKALTGDREMVPRDQLFATLDVTAHAGYLPNSMLAVFMDTVGFMSNLPRSLSTAFAATLEDAMCADLIVHVRDISHPNRQSQRAEVISSVERMLNETQLQTMIEVCNKVDKVDSLEEVREDSEGIFYISSVTGEGLDVLRQEVQTRLLSNIGLLQKRIRVPMSGEHLSWLYKEATVTDTETDNDAESLIVHVVIAKEMYAKFVSRFGGGKIKARSRYE